MMVSKVLARAFQDGTVLRAAAGFSPMGEISERQARFEARAFQEGTVLRAKDGTRYVMGHVTALSCTLRRVVPKVRGKQARREDRRRRRELRETQQERPA